MRGTQHLAYVRYALLASPALYAIVASMLSDHPRRWMRHVPPLLIALACLAALPAAYEAWWKADWRGFAGSIDRHLRDGRLTIYYDRRLPGETFAGEPDSNFLYASYYRRPPFGPTILMDRPPDAAVLWLAEWPPQPTATATTTTTTTTTTTPSTTAPVSSER